MEGNDIFKLLIQELGESVAYKVFSLLAGQQVYIPVSVLRLIRNRLIRQIHLRSKS